jgi:hypothetical protein
MRAIGVVVAAVAGCGPGPRDNSDAPVGDPADARADGTPLPDAVDATPPCPPPPNPAGPNVVIAPPYDLHYTAYDLGAPPGIPNPLGGSAVLVTDDNTLLIAGSSENSAGAIYSIGVTRDSCGHILGFAGTAQVVATTPFVDANLVYESPALMLYTEWPQFRLSQLPAGATTPARQTDLIALGMPSADDQGPGGLGIVPPGLAGAGGLRLVTWPRGRWFQVTTAPDGPLLAITAIQNTVTIPNEPGGFAYVPAGSPGFPQQAVIVAEWRIGTPALDRVVVYDVDPQGDPIVGTRREFFSSFPRPWGAYFEPVTGDYLFLSWGTGQDHVYVVQGFVPPPPIE